MSFKLTLPLSFFVSEEKIKEIVARKRAEEKAEKMSSEQEASLKIIPNTIPAPIEENDHHFPVFGIKETKNMSSEQEASSSKTLLEQVIDEIDEPTLQELEHHAAKRRAEKTGFFVENACIHVVPKTEFCQRCEDQGKFYCIYHGFSHFPSCQYCKAENKPGDPWESDSDWEAVPKEIEKLCIHNLDRFNCNTCHPEEQTQFFSVEKLPGTYEFPPMQRKGKLGTRAPWLTHLDRLQEMINEECYRVTKIPDDGAGAPFAPKEKIDQLMTCVTYIREAWGHDFRGEKPNYDPALD